MAATPATPKPLSAALLNGPPGREGFLYHDGHNRPVLQAAPGLLGLVESRHVIARWKPDSLRWLDATEHFFQHLDAEFERAPAFEPVRAEIEQIRGLDADLPVKNQFLFQYLDAAVRDLERAAVANLAPLRLAPATAPASQSLNGPWRARYRSREGHYTERDLRLPVNWELVPGIANYAGTMRFTRVVTLGDERRGQRLVLRLHGVDYFADVWVNGHHVGGHEGVFAPWELDITPFVRFDHPTIVRLSVTSPNDPAGPGTNVSSGWDDFAPSSSFPNRKTLVKGTLGHHDAKRGGAWSSLTSQDGNTGGVWNDVELRLLNPVHLTGDGVRVTTRSATPDGAGVSVQVKATIRNTTDRVVEARVRVHFDPANFEGSPHELSQAVVLRPGANEVTLVDRLAPVRLWWPRDLGFPHLYTLTATVEVEGAVQDRSTAETGFRTLAVSPIGESTGDDGAFVVNGRRVFVRGTNLLPTYWLSEYTPERIERDFQLLSEAGFNAVLVHALVLPRRFYEEASRRGFLVVQIFPLQWTYEQSAHFWSRVCPQAQEMAGLLVNHPSVVSYEVHNEPDMRTFEDLDNRVMAFDLHAAVRAADPSRWATTYSSGNHAYPGQFYPLRDDNSFATLPGRFLEEEYNGRRISRHRNMPTEFGIQAMPHVELFRRILAEDRFRAVLERIRTDPKWLANGAGAWQDAEKTIEEAKSVLGGGDWEQALAAFDWAVMWDIGALVQRAQDVDHDPQDGDPAKSREVLALKLAVLVVEVLHYGGFKGENFWFGLWRPAHSLEEFVRSSQDRQYRLHKDAIEMYLNAGALGPITGYFSFMLRDPDWQAPTWGVVDAGWAPKKAYRAYLESNHPVRVTLPPALRNPVKLPGDAWLAPTDDAGRGPWADADVIVANDTGVALAQARVTIWLEAEDGTRLGSSANLTVDLEAGGAWSGSLPTSDWTVPSDVRPGVYYLKAQIASADGAVRSTNSYEFWAPDTSFPELARLPKRAVKPLLTGAPGTEGFHYWRDGSVVFDAASGLRGLANGFREAQVRGIDLYETIQGEHLFRHVLSELAGMPYATRIAEDIWRIRSETTSPSHKARTLIRYVDLFVDRAERRLAQTKRMPAKEE